MHEFEPDTPDPFAFDPDTPPDDDEYGSLEGFFGNTEVSDRLEPAPTDFDAPHVIEHDHATTLDEGGRELVAVTASFFFRGSHKNVATIAGTIAPAMMARRPEGDTLYVLDAGCSSGQDTLSTAAVLSASGVDYHIDGVDINSRMIAQTNKPYKTTKDILHRGIIEWDAPDETLDFFDEVDAYHVQPSAAIRERVAFHHADLRQQPLPSAGQDGYDVVVANNMLMYYEAHEVDSLHAMVDAVTANLRPGGLFTFSDRVDHRALMWLDDALAARGLLPIENEYGIPDETWQNLAIYRKTSVPIPENP